MAFVRGLSRRNTRALLLGYIVPALVVLPSAVWIMLDTSAWGGDQTQYGRAAVELYSSLRRAPGQWPSRMLDVFPWKPNGLIWIGQFFVPLGLSLGSIDTALLLSVALMQVVTLLLMYRSVLELSPKKTALAPMVACLALGSAPLFVTFGQYFLVETLQALSVAWFILIMSCARRWSGPLIMAQLAGAATLAMSAKSIQPLFCVWPGVLGLYYALASRARGDQGRRPGRVWTLVTVAATVPAAALIAAWYRRNLDAVMMHGQVSSYGSRVRVFWGQADTYLNTLVYWLQTLLHAAFGPGMWVCWLLVVGGLATYLVARSRPTMRHFTLCAAIAVLQITTVVLVFSLSETRQKRYLLPLLPYCALLLAWGVAQINRVVITRLAVLAFVAQLAIVHAQALNLMSLPFVLVRGFERDAQNSHLLDAIVARTCPAAGSYFNVLAIDTAIEVLPGGDWLGAEQANYVVAKRALERNEAPRCSYGYPGDGFFGSSVPKAWESMLSRRAAFFITIDPAVYPVPAQVFNEALSRDNFPLMLQKVYTSGLFEPEPPLAEYPGVLLFHRIDHVARGRALSDQGRHDEAVAGLRKAADLEPTHIGAWANLNLAYSRDGRDQEGIDAGYRGLSLSADHYWLNIVTAEMLDRRGQWRDAITLGRRALEHAPNPEQRARVLTLLGGAYAKVNDASSACRAFLELESVRNSAEAQERISALRCRSS